MQSHLVALHQNGLDFRNANFIIVCLKCKGQFELKMSVMD